jgi:hypothetical protein
MFKVGISDVEVMVFYALYVFNIQSIVWLCGSENLIKIDDLSMHSTTRDRYYQEKHG